jgi:ligand-binding sensor domain-containing protein
VVVNACIGAQVKTEHVRNVASFKADDTIAKRGPITIVRNIIQDRKGNIWIASFRGIFKYDGKSFVNMTSEVSSARFFSILEDRNGNFWFGSIGSGVFYYDGKSFRNFTIKDGLLNNGVTCIYEDKAGNIWFGVSGGASRYDGKSFRNYIIEGNTMNEDRTGKVFPDRRPFEVNAIIEDKTGKFWFATRGNTFVYDGKAFSVIAQAGKPFKNVRSVIKDTKGRIWLGGNDGLWRYEGGSFTQASNAFTGCIYEDRQGNLWTGSGTDFPQRWTLSRYNAKTLSARTISSPKAMATAKIVFTILEAKDGVIWFSTFKGLHRLDGKKVNYADGSLVKAFPFGLN